MCVPMCTELGDIEGRRDGEAKYSKRAVAFVLFLGQKVKVLLKAGLFSQHQVGQGVRKADFHL